MTVARSLACSRFAPGSLTRALVQFVYGFHTASETEV